MPVIQVLSRELRSELGIAPFFLSSGAFGHPDVKATLSEGNIWDFHGGEMETSMVMAVDESLVKLETSEAGLPASFVDNHTLLPYGAVSIGWVSEDWRTEDGKPIGIGGDPSGATAEKGRIILEKLRPIIYDEEQVRYLALGDKIADAFKTGMAFRRALEDKER